VINYFHSEMVVTVWDKSSMKEAWDNIATMHVGDGRVKNAMSQQLRCQFNLVTFAGRNSNE
jgi:hypothetical protein